MRISDWSSDVCSSDPPFLSAQAAESEVFRSLRTATVSSSFVPGEWQEALQAIDQAVRQFGEYGLNQDELERANTRFRARHQHALKSASTPDSFALAATRVFAVTDQRLFPHPP